MTGIVLVVAKAPTPGRSKTRLVPPLSAAQWDRGVQDSTEHLIYLRQHLRNGFCTAPRPADRRDPLFRLET